MFYTVYRTTNNITNEIYIGQHITEDPNDGYLGSGTRIRNAIKKYGKSNFTKEIIAVFDNYKDMDALERKIVNEEFIKRSDTYNVILGGGDINVSGTVLCRLKDSTSSPWHRVPIDEYFSNKEKYETVNSGVVYVIIDGKYTKIPRCEYDPNIHKKSSTGMVNVVDITTGVRSRIPVVCKDNNHRPLFGGIVINNNGVKRYASLEEFNSGSHSGVHKGKVTARNTKTGEVKHVDRNAFWNTNEWVHSTSGTVTGRNRISGEKKRFRTEDVTDEIRKEYKFSSDGYRTVFDTVLSKFMNVPKSDYDPSRHRLAQDKMFNWYAQDGTLIRYYFGDKISFLSSGIPESIWSAMLKGKVVKSTKMPLYNGSYFEVIDWRKLYGI